MRHNDARESFFTAYFAGALDRQTRRTLRNLTELLPPPLLQIPPGAPRSEKRGRSRRAPDAPSFAHASLGHFAGRARSALRSFLVRIAGRWLLPSRGAVRMPSRRRRRLGMRMHQAAW
jgi:hypothetical protein